MSKLSRRQDIFEEVQSIVGEMTGLPPASISPACTPKELGLSEVQLQDLSASIEKSFGIPWSC
jgi:acyl carrier protein